MFNIGGQEFALIIVLALVVVGPEQLPGLIRKMGQYAAQARRMSSQLRAEFMAATEPMHDTFKEFQEGMNEFQTGMNDFSKSVTDALQYLAKHGIGDASAPVLIRFVATIAKRFGIVVTQKAMAQTLPVIGAVGGGLVNTMFISHFQDMARAHFAIRRLEREHGEDVVKHAYEQLSRQDSGQ